MLREGAEATARLVEARDVSRLKQDFDLCGAGIENDKDLWVFQTNIMGNFQVGRSVGRSALVGKGPTLFKDWLRVREGEECKALNDLSSCPGAALWSVCWWYAGHRAVQRRGGRPDDGVGHLCQAGAEEARPLPAVCRGQPGGESKKKWARLEKGGFEQRRSPCPSPSCRQKCRACVVLRSSSCTS